MWIARDGERDGKNDGALTGFECKPKFDASDEMFYCADNSEHVNLWRHAFPEVLNGTCFKLVIGEEVKDG